MREEALRAYLHETARAWRPGAGPAYGARVLRMKTYVTQEATKLCAELFALSGGQVVPYRPQCQPRERGNDVHDSAA